MVVEIKETTLNILVKLCEGIITPEQWINEWRKNETEWKKEFPPSWYLKIKPKLSQGMEGATLISQNSCKEYLNLLNIQFCKENTNELKKQWIDTINNISIRDDSISNKMNKYFTELKENYPMLFYAIIENFIIGDDIKKDYNKDYILHHPNSKFLPHVAIDFFSYVSLLKMDSVFFDFDNIYTTKDDKFVKIGELWLNNDGDEILLEKNDSKVYLNDIGSHKIKLLDSSFYNFFENIVSGFFGNVSD